MSPKERDRASRRRKEALKQLERSLGVYSVIGISIGAMLGSGIFVLPGLAFAKTGPSVWLAYVIGGICALPAALSKAELATAMPSSGGTYVYIDRTFGPLAGTIAGLGLWLSLLLKSAFALVGFGAYLFVLADLPLKPTALSLLVGIVILNIVGVRKVGRIQIAVVTVALCALGGFVALGLPAAARAPGSPVEMTNGLSGLIATTAFIFVSYAGVTKAAAVAGEVQRPGRNLPVGILVSLGLVMVVYAFAVFVMSRILPAGDFARDPRPVYTLAEALGGTYLGWFAAGLGVVTMVSMSNAGLLASSRFPYAMARDDLLPRFMRGVHPRFSTPVMGVLFTGILMGLAISFFDLEKIAKLASAFVIMIYVFENFTVIVLRESSAQWYKPSYRSPFYPWTQVFGIVSGLALLLLLKTAAVMAALGVAVPGIALFLVYGRRLARRSGQVGKIGRRLDLLMQSEQENAKEADWISEESSGSTLVALFGGERSPETLALMGLGLSSELKQQVIHITEIPDEPLTGEVSREESRALSSLRRRLEAMGQVEGAAVDFHPLASRDPARTVQAVTDRLQSDWLVMCWQGRPSRGVWVRDSHAWMLNHIRCNVAVFKDAGVRYIRKILVLAEPGPHDALIVDTADRLAGQHGAELTFARYVPEDTSQAMLKSQIDYLEELRSLCRATTGSLILRAQGKVASLVEASASYDLLVMGAPPEGTFRSMILKSDADRVIENAACSVLRLKTPRVRTHEQFDAARSTKAEMSSTLESFLEPDCVEARIGATKKEPLFEMFAEYFSKVVHSVSAEQIERALWERERTQNTSVGNGLALPHATIPEAPRSSLAVFTTRSPVAYQAIDGEPVDVFFVTLGPPSERQEHLILLSTVANLVTRTGIIEKLRDAQTKEQILEAIRDCSAEIEGERPVARSEKAEV